MWRVDGLFPRVAKCAATISIWQMMHKIWTWVEGFWVQCWMCCNCNWYLSTDVGPNVTTTMIIKRDSSENYVAYNSGNFIFLMQRNSRMIVSLSCKSSFFYEAPCASRTPSASTLPSWSILVGGSSDLCDIISGSRLWFACASSSRFLVSS